MIKVVIFDIGGVIVDFMNEYYYYPYLSKVSGVGVRRVKQIIENSPLWSSLDKDEITQREFDERIARELKIPQQGEVVRELREDRKDRQEGHKDSGEIIEKLQGRVPFQRRPLQVHLDT